MAELRRLADEFVFPGCCEWLRELPDRRVHAVSFDAHFRIQEDRLDWRTDDSRSMIVVRFAEPDRPVPSDPWSLRVRGSWPDRRDRLPDASPFSSKAFRKDRRRKGGRSAAASSSNHSVRWCRHENLWIADGQAREDVGRSDGDLVAQVSLFLLQTGLAAAEDEIRDEFVAYLRRTFKWRNLDAPDTAVYVVYDHLLRHRWWPDDWRAWRMYVCRCIDAERRKQAGRVRLPVVFGPDSDGLLTVDQFAAVTGHSRTKAYNEVRAGHIPAQHVRGRMRVALADAETICRTAKRKDVIDLLVERGRSYDAARKWVHRQERSGKTLDDIARAIARRKPVY